MSEKSENRILIKNVTLVESEFSKIDLPLTDTLNEEVNLNINIENENEKEFYVFLFLEFNLYNNLKEKLVKSKITMKGIFELENEKPEFFNDFLCINAPAIIYPYMREHLSSLTNKSGLPPINLPPFNFVNFGKEYLKNKVEKL